jgi:HAD superfamily hydrolase (TIGR01549 family)
MKTIIFDIDGTLTDMWPIEKSVLLRMTKGKYKKEINALKAMNISDTYIIFRNATKKSINKTEYWRRYNRAFSMLLRTANLPRPKPYSSVDWIIKNKNRYRLVYATGGQEKETKYVLKKLKIFDLFDDANSITKNRCRFSKKTGISFRKLKKEFGDCLLVADGDNDIIGARRAGIQFIKIKNN